MNSQSLKTWLEIIKATLDILTGLATFVGVVIAALAAYGILLMSAKPKVIIETIVHWPPGSVSNDYLLSANLRFLNPAIGSKVVTEIYVDRLTIEEGHIAPCRMSPYAFLTPLVLGANAEFEGRPQEFVKGFIMIGHGQGLKHVAFIPDQENEFQPVAGRLTIRLSIDYKIHHPLSRIFRGEPATQTLEVVRSKNIDAQEAADLTTQKCCWLGRDLEIVD